MFFFGKFIFEGGKFIRFVSYGEFFVFFGVFVGVFVGFEVVFEMYDFYDYDVGVVEDEGEEEGEVVEVYVVLGVEFVGLDFEVFVVYDGGFVEVC